MLFRSAFALLSCRPLLCRLTVVIVAMRKCSRTYKVQYTVQVVNFPFPSPPNADALRAAERSLVHISALQRTHTAESAASPVATGANFELTSLGRAMAAFPIAPRQSRVILEAAQLVAEGRAQESVVTLAVALAAAMSVESPFMHVDTAKAVAAREADDGAGDAKVCLF